MIDSSVLSLFAPALFACLLISLVNGPLGAEVVRRGIIFIDLAIAHIAGLGFIAGTVLFPDAPFWLLQFITYLFVLSFASIFWILERKLPQRVEAWIGVSFILAASMTFLLVDDHPHAGGLIKNLLSGQILFTTWDDVAKLGSVYGLVIAAMWLKRAHRHPYGFYVLFTLAITTCIPIAGVYLIFASLILPGLAAERTSNPTIAVVLIGILSTVLGVTVGMLLDLPNGPCLVVSYVVVTSLVMLKQLKSRHISEG